MSKMAIFLSVSLIGASASAAPVDAKKMDMKMDMKMMDANGDGMISKDEFMKYHEMMFDKMKKNNSGMVDLKDMETMHQNMQMMHKGMAKEKDHTSMKDKVAK
jgi:hypothetical protein